MAKNKGTQATVTPTPPPSDGLKQFASRIPSDLHRQMKMACAGQGIKLETFVAQALSAGLAALTARKVASK